MLASNQTLNEQQSTLSYINICKENKDERKRSPGIDAGTWIGLSPGLIRHVHCFRMDPTDLSKLSSTVYCEDVLVRVVARFGPKMASEMILEYLILKVFREGGMPPNPP